ncbi:unknown [Clostridium sp. CAG:632]|nr:unknown [Clostridium sp. CAG:632]
MLSGATGATQGRHLHFEVRVGGYQSSRYSVNPMNYY